jgi:hypothetical protein
MIIKIATHSYIHETSKTCEDYEFFEFLQKKIQKGGKIFDALDVSYTYWEKRKALFVAR